MFLSFLSEADWWLVGFRPKPAVDSLLPNKYEQFCVMNDPILAMLERRFSFSEVGSDVLREDQLQGRESERERRHGGRGWIFAAHIRRVRA